MGFILISVANSMAFRRLICCGEFNVSAMSCKCCYNLPETTNGCMFNVL